MPFHLISFHADQYHERRRQFTGPWAEGSYLGSSFWERSVFFLCYFFLMEMARIRPILCIFTESSLSCRSINSLEATCLRLISVFLTFPRLSLEFSSKSNIHLKNSVTISNAYTLILNSSFRNTFKLFKA